MKRDEEMALRMLGRQVGGAEIGAVAEALEELGVVVWSGQRLARQVGGVALGGECVELALPRGADLERLRGELLALGDELGVDLALGEAGTARGFGLVALDMDSTLIGVEVVDELAAVAGVGAEVAAITARSMAGEVGFAESLRERVAMLAGLPEAALAEVAGRLPLSEGAEALLAALRGLGCKTAILSGGFAYFAEHLQRRLGIDYAHANRLEIRGGRLTGRVLAPILDAEGKARLLGELAAREGLGLEQTVAVGDGANDLAMLGAAGLGVAYRGKRVVREAAGVAIDHIGLDGVLYLMGVVPAKGE